METEEILLENKKDTFTYIIVTQIICVVLILLTIFTTKLFFTNIFKEIKTFYNETFCIETDINQVISEEK